MNTETDDIDLDAHLARTLANFKPRPQAEVEAFTKANDEKENKKARWKNWAAKDLPAVNAIQLADFSGEFGAKLDYLKSKLGKVSTIALIGKCGRGKTQLGVELLRHRSGFFTTGVRIGMALRAFDTAEDRMNEFCRHKLLVIDEAFKRQESDWMTDMFFELVNRRYSEGLDTILIDNLSEQELAVKCGAAILDRMRQSGGIVVCDWKNYRENYKQPENFAEELAGYNEARRAVK